MPSKNDLLNAVIVAGYLLLVFSAFSTQFFDDLGFDYAGYALRYNYAFEGWSKNLLLGVPVSTFDGFLPSFLPLFFKFLGFGAFTLPLTLSIFVLRLLVPLAFIPIGNLFRLNKRYSLTAGLVFALNPITFKFFARYYEFFAWFAFLFAFVFFYKFLEEKGFSRKYFLLSSLAISFVALSHTATLFFLAPAFLVMVKSLPELKKLFSVGLLSAGLTSFWVLPFFAFLPFSVVSTQAGLELVSAGIMASNYFFVALLLLVFAFFLLKRIPFSERIFRLLALALALSCLQTFFPFLPLIEKPFAHSFHVFFVFVLLLSGMFLFRRKVFSEKTAAYSLALAAAFLLLAVFFVPKINSQYFLQEPRFSSYSFGGVKDFSEVDALLTQIPHKTRFEVFPYDPIISAYSSLKYDLSSLLGWGYNAYALSEGFEFRKLVSMGLGCEEFREGAALTSTTHWVSLSEGASAYLSGCGFLPVSEPGKIPALFVLPENAPLIENAELLQYENTYIKAKVSSGEAFIKVNYFPGWKAFLDGKEVPVEKHLHGMKVFSGKPATLELKYLPTAVDWIAIIISLVSLGGFLFIFFRR